jgi:hypothetical protein
MHVARLALTPRLRNPPLHLVVMNWVRAPVPFYNKE